MRHKHNPRSAASYKPPMLIEEKTALLVIILGIVASIICIALQHNLI